MRIFNAAITFRWFKNVFSFVLFFLIIVEIIIVVLINQNLYSGVESYLDRRNEANVKTFGDLIKKNRQNIYNISAEFFIGMEDIKNVRIELYDENGRNFRSSDGMTAANLDMRNAAEEKTVIRNQQTGERLLVMTVPLKDGGGAVIGAVRYIVSLENVYSRQSVYLFASVTAMVVVAAFVFLSGQYFVQLFVNPVITITQSARMIAKGDFSIRTQKKYNDEIGALSDSINNMAQELSKIDTLKNEFISSISHELRTPLTAIRGWNETIAVCDPETDRETIRKGISIIDAETDRLARMIEELLDYSKIQSGRFTISKSKINLFTILLDTLDIYSQKAMAAGIDIAYELPTFEPIITGDANRIKQVFINVLDNAVKHSEKGSKIDIRYIKYQDSYTVVFRDHGSGIKKEELPYIKGRFYKGSSTKPGSGLGLSICEEIVALHGGTLEIDSAEGDGTTVAVSFPSV